MGANAGISINVTGMSGIMEDFARFGDEIQRKTLDVAGRKGAEVMKKATIRNAPDSGIDRSKFGKVAVKKDGTIGIKYEYQRKHLRQQINIQKVKDKAGNPKYLVRVGDAYWANFLEKGTVERKGRGKISKEKTEFMDRTVEQTEAEVVSIFERELDTALSKFR